MAIFVMFLLVSVIRPRNALPAILTDFVIELKPFLIYYIVRETGFCVDERWKPVINRLSLLLPLTLLPLGFYVLGQEEVEMPFFGHLSRYGSFMSIMGMVYLWSSKQSKRDVVISILIVCTAILSGRSKSYGFAAIYIAIFLILMNAQQLRKLSFKTVIMGVVLLLLVLYVSWDKISFYFIEGASDGRMMARPALYLGAVEILGDYPIFGSGLGTYATYASSAYYSPLYYEYGLNEINGLEEGGEFICDTFFPEMAQFGLVGIILFLLFWVLRVREIKREYTNNTSNYNAVIEFLIIFFIFIESIADTTFTQNRGFMVMMLLAVLQNEYSHVTTLPDKTPNENTLPA